MEKNIDLIFGAYRRKSEEDKKRQVLSLEDQEREIAEVVKRDGLKVGKHYRGESRTAYKRGRPIFAEVIRDIEDGAINALIVWHPNRLARNAFDAGMIITLMDEGKLYAVKTPSRTFFNNGTDKFILGIEFDVAKKTSDDNGEAVKRSLRSKMEQGWMPCTAPQGYLNTKLATRGTNYITVDPERFPILRRAWDLMLTGTYTVDQILEILSKDWGYRTQQKNERGGKPLSRSALYKIFSNPFYAGLIPYQIGGRKNKTQNELTLTPGKHEPMLTLDEFDKVQIILGRGGKRRPTRNIYAYNGDIDCGECGGFVSATYKKKICKSTGELRHYILYYCVKAKKNPEACSQAAYARVQVIEEKIEEKLTDLAIMPEFLTWALRILENENGANESAESLIAVAHHKAVGDAKKQLDKLVDLSLKGLIDDQNFERKSIELKNELARLELKTKEQEVVSNDWIKLTAKTFEFSYYAHNSFVKGDEQQRREILTALGLNRWLFDGTFSFQAMEWFIPIAEMYPPVEAKIRAFEPALYGTEQWEKTAFAAFNPLVRGRRDLNSQPPA